MTKKYSVFLCVQVEAESKERAFDFVVEYLNGYDDTEPFQDPRLIIGYSLQEVVQDD